MSTTIEDVRRALALHFETGWQDEAGGARTPVAWPNVSFSPPADAAWVRFTLLPAEARRHLITGQRETGQRITGLVVIQVFTPAGAGDGEAMTLAGVAGDLWTERRIEALPGRDPLFTFVPEIRVIGAAREWFQVNVTIPFEHLTT